MTEKEIDQQKSEACNDIIDSESFIAITTVGNKFSVSHHVAAQDLAKVIGWLEVVKLDMVEIINEAGEDV